MRGATDLSGVALAGHDLVFPTRFRVAETAAGALGAGGFAVSNMWDMKTNRRRNASVDVRAAEAALTSFACLQCRQGDGSYQTWSSFIVMRGRQARTYLSEPPRIVRLTK